MKKAHEVEATKEYAILENAWTEALLHDEDPVEAYYEAAAEHLDANALVDMVRYHKDERTRANREGDYKSASIHEDLATACTDLVFNHTLSLFLIVRAVRLMVDLLTPNISDDSDSVYPRSASLKTCFSLSD